MKNRLHALLFSLLPGSLLAQTGSFELSGRIGNASAPAIAYLLYPNGNTYVQDSVAPSNGVFVFKGQVDHPIKGTLMIKHWTNAGHPGSTYSDKMPIYIEKGKTTITSLDSLHDATITGSPLTNDLRALEAMLKPVQEKAQAVYLKYAEALAKKDSAASVAYMGEIKPLQEEQKDTLKAFMKKHAHSEVSLFALKTFTGGIPEYASAKPLFDGLSSSVRNSYDGKAYADLLEKTRTTTIGAMAPDFTENDVNGKPVQLSSLRGKYVLVDFWASWCGPCRAENPNVVRLYQKYKDRNFTVLGVSLDQSNAKEKWLKAIADDHLDWTQVSDLSYWDNKAAVLYGIKAIPQNFLLDPTGKIIGKNLRGEELADMLAAVL